MREIGRRAARGGERGPQFEDRNGAHMPVIRALNLRCQIEQLGRNLVLRARQFSARPALAWREIEHIGKILRESQADLCAASATIQPGKREQRIADARGVIDLGLGDPQPRVLREQLRITRQSDTLCRLDRERRGKPLSGLIMSLVIRQRHRDFETPASHDERLTVGEAAIGGNAGTTGDEQRSGQYGRNLQRNR